MSEIRKEILGYIDILPDNKLEALKPLITLLVNDSVVVETNLTDEERAIIARGREEHKKGGYVPLDSIR